MEIAAVDQLKGAVESAAVLVLPGQCGMPAPARFGFAQGFSWPGLPQIRCLQPEAFGQMPGIGGIVDHAVDAQPAAASLAAQLPAGEHRLDRGHRHRVLLMSGGLLEEAEAEQHPRPGLGRAVGPTIHQPSQRQIAEALRQFEATAPRQLQLLATPGGSQTQPRGTVPEHPEVLLAVQPR